jgi:hypothetical protein
MDVGQFLVSLVGGGLAGGCMSVVSGRVFYRRTLRTQFHPILNHFWGAYLVRFERPEGRHLTTVVGKVPLSEDDGFIRHRSSFIHELVRFNELKEARELRKGMIANLNPRCASVGSAIETDLTPEYESVSKCLKIVQGKLKLYG